MKIVSDIFSTFSERKSKNKQINKSEDFSSLFENVDYEKLLEDTLSTMSDLEKEAHIEILKVLKEFGIEESELFIINFHLLNKNSLNHELPYTEEEDKLIKQYESLFSLALDTIKSTRKRLLSFKKLQTQTNVTDIILESLNIHNNKSFLESRLKIEV